MKLQIFVALCVLNVYAECKWRAEYPYETRGNPTWPRRNILTDEANEIPTHRTRVRIPDPPNHTKLIPMARYVLHNSGERDC